MSSQEDDDEYYSEGIVTEMSSPTTLVELDFAPNRYKILNSSEIMDKMTAKVMNVKTIIGDSLTNSYVRKLLNKHRWDTDKFLEEFYINDSSASLQEVETHLVKENLDPAQNKKKKPKASQVPVENASTSTARRVTRSQARKREYQLEFLELSSEPPRKIRISALSQQNSSTESKVDVVACEICFDTITVKNFHTWDCHHKICKGCFNDYLVEKVTNNQSLAVIECPGYRCETILSDDEIIKTLEAPYTGKYFQLITNEFVLSNRMIRWCPGKQCTNAIEMIDIIKQPAVRCSCGDHFCFSCSHFVHDLISCDLMIKFEQLKAKDLPSANWIAQNCKQCPKCKSEINKNGGCNHMTCRKCNNEFCWICLLTWSTHHGGPCPGAKIDTFTENDKTNTRRLVACVTKHGSMVDSLKMDEINYKKYIEVQELHAKDQWFKVEFIKQAIDTILKCRRILCDSFVMELFMMDETNPQWLCFQLNQNDLLRATEDLSSIMENEVTVENYHTMKLILGTSTNYCNNLYKALYEISKEGFENNLWKKID